ncbi:MAG TPA: ABC transporter substrate-binding protein, partial [Acidimicrobiales bacterium]|nr:ABC transporter substrate-binding protein [Acidimicrobiales bacterium]
AGMLVDSLLCEPLLRLDPVTGKLRPGLAATWIVSNGGRRITMRLRKGARFADGAKVTSDDVIASLSRAASEEFAGNAADLLAPVDGWEEISGRVQSARERDRRVLRGLAAIDGSSFSISLRAPDADFLRVLAHPVAAPVPRARAERDPDGFAAQPSCAGPYQLSAPWSPGDPVIRLVRNARFKGTPVYADVVEFHVAEDPLSLWQAGKVDVAPRPAARAAEVPEPDRVERPNGYVDYVGVPIADPQVRVALSVALDRAAAAAASPARQPARGFLPPAAGPAGRTDGCGENAPLRGDPTRARALAQGRLPNPQAPIELLFNDELGNRPVVEAVARQWHDVLGLDVRLKPTPFDQIVRDGARPEGVGAAFRMGWQPPAPRPESYIGPLFTSAGVGRDNLARFVDPEVERKLAREARNASNEQDRDLAYRAVEQQLCQAMPLIPVAAGVSRWAARAAAVGGVTLDRARGWPVLRDMYVRSGGKP